MIKETLCKITGILAKITGTVARGTVVYLCSNERERKKRHHPSRPQ